MNFILITLLSFGCVGISAEKIVIVGGGAAGLAAASRLISKGHKDVVILEAQQRLGGRVRTEKEGRKVIEFGAEWLMGEDGNVLYDFAQDNHIKLVTLDTDSDVYVTTNGDTIAEDNIDNAWNKYVELVAQLRTSEKIVSDFFDEEIAKISGDKDLNRSMFKYYFESITPVGNWSNEIGVGFDSHVSIDGSSAMSVAAGMEHLLTTMMQYPRDTSNTDWNNVVKFGCVVQNIQWNAAKPIVAYQNLNSNNMETIEADIVIVTVSLGVLKEKYQTLFSPSLPSKNIQAIQTIQFVVVNKIFLTFEKAWWPDDANLHIIWTSNTDLSEKDKWLKNIVGFYSKQKLPRTLCAWVVEDDGCLSESATDYTALASHLKRSFAKQEWNVTEPVTIIGTKWYENSYFRGSYSYRGAEAYRRQITNDDLKEPLINADGKKTVYFAGEATHKTYYATLHGAVESGFSVADEIVAS